jgi:hypothetical protein
MLCPPSQGSTSSGSPQASERDEVYFHLTQIELLGHDKPRSLMLKRLIFSGQNPLPDVVCKDLHAENPRIGLDLLTRRIVAVSL